MRPTSPAAIDSIDYIPLGLTFILTYPSTQAHTEGVRKNQQPQTTPATLATSEENNTMRPQKTLAYLVPQAIREHVNARATALHVNRRVAAGRSDSLAEGDYQDAISRLYELQTLVNTIARTENAAIVENHEDFNAGLFIEDRSAIDYEGPQDYDIFTGPLPAGPSSVATAKGEKLQTWEEVKAAAIAAAAPVAERHETALHDYAGNPSEEAAPQEGEAFQAECDKLDEEWENRTAPEDTPEDTPSIELEGTIFDPNL